VFAQNVELFSNRHIRARLVPWGDDFDRLMIGDWLAALRAGNPPPITGEDGLRAVELVQSAYQSARTNQPVAVQRG
jgi:predicted dehydrogenase